jgi:hypothetical protein
MGSGEDTAGKIRKWRSPSASRMPVDFRELAMRLADSIESLARQLTGEAPTSRNGARLRFRAQGSLAVVVAGAERGTWFDYDPPASGRPPGPKGVAGGDALDLVAHFRGCGRAAAATWAQAWLGDARLCEYSAPPARPAARPVRKVRVSGTLELARQIWFEAVAAEALNSLVPNYLASRGLRFEAGLPLRFHPACPRGAERWPAMLALLTDPISGETCGVHRTFLARDGQAKAPGPMPTKMMVGRAGVVRLALDDEVTTGLGIAEGIETSLSVMQGFGWRPIWAATSAGAIRAFPLLPGISALTVFADADSAGLTAAQACADRWRDAGAESRICAPPAGDFNDLAGSCAA